MRYWNSLSRGEQFAIALNVARRRGVAFCREIDNVVSVGAGFRLRGKESALVEEVCICFLVRRKWNDRRFRIQKVPEYVNAFPKVNGKRVRVRIPTDVSEFKGGSPQADLNLTSGITSRKNGGLLNLGAACCLVKNVAAPSERYLLTCYHTFSAGLLRPPESGIDCVAGPTVLGSLDCAANGDGPSALDAALVLVTDSSIQGISIWGIITRSKATDFDIDQLPMRGQLFVLGREIAPAVPGKPEEVRLRPIPATFRALIATPMAFDYSKTAGRVLWFKETIEYKAEVREGDSGAALVDTSGMLYGMHFFGRGEFGYAFSAPRIFDPNIFPFDIELQSA